MICQRCLKNLPDKPAGASVHTCTPSKLVRELEQRIKELEAELESRKSTNAGWNAYYALRRKIEDAPVVCVARTRPLQGYESLPTTHAEWKLPARGALVHKEDLA